MISIRGLAGPGSVRGYAQRLGDNPAASLSVRRLASADLLQRRWDQYGGLKVLGSPQTDVSADAKGYFRRYSAGTLRLTAGAAQLEQQLAYRASVFVAGVSCVKRAETDQVGGPSSEPYLIATVIDESMTKGEARSILVGGKAAENIDGGDWIGYGEKIWEGANPRGLQVQLAMWEEDGGQSAEIRKKVQTTINDALNVASIFLPAIGLIKSTLGPVADRVIKAMANMIKELFRDDYIAENAALLDYAEFMGDKVPKVEEFNGAKYRLIVPVNGGSAGDYRVYLHWTVTPIPVPLP